MNSRTQGEDSRMQRTPAISMVSSAALAVGILAASPAMAQDASQPAAASSDTGTDANGDTLNTIVVTASVGNKSKLDTSVSISSVDASVIDNFHPQSEGDLLRLLPGLQPSVTGPGGNGNFAVRGLPVATGGATFVQLQEDGLPLTLYGDIQFGNNDYWTKFSPTDERVEAIRGGTAATLASQAPGAVVNYISKTSRSEGGYIQVEAGTNYDYKKFSFLDSGILSDSVYYNIGGYYDVGHGGHHAGYNVSDSYLIKGNITKEFEGGQGYFRLLFKVADTREPNDTGGLICGSISGGVASNITTCPGFDIRSQSNYSLYNANVKYVDYNSGGVAEVPLAGITTKEKALQAQLHYEFGDSLTLDNNARYAKMSGGFASNFFSIAPISGLIGSTVNGGVVARAVYSAGPNMGQDVSEPFYNSNVNVYTHIRSLDSFANDLKLNGKTELGGNANASLTAGVFFMSQQIAMDWHPNQFRSQASGDNPSPIDLLDSSGNLLSAAGFTGYNNNWGSCCARTYDYTFSDTAPYADLILDVDRFELDASIRHDINHGSGSGTKSTGTTHYMPQTATNPVTGATQTVNVPYFLPDSAPEVLNYTKPLTSWSVGASFKPTDNLNLFVRASKGTRFNADRLTFGGNFNPDGTLNTAGETAVSDNVYQYEIGLKNRGNIGMAHYTVELTVYSSHFNITTYELNPNVCGPLGFSGGTCPISDNYKTKGAEFYGTLRVGGLNLIANMTYNKAKKQSQSTGPFIRSNGIPDLSYSLAANYQVGDAASLGFNLAGVTSTTNSNNVVFPGSSIVSANLKLYPMKNFELGLNVYNLFNKVALLGPDHANEIVNGSTFVGTASAAYGRLVTASAKFSF